eukprot:TRINITY_DN5218_c0_g1_i1.p1 TRINITY_DN5218_c0_g1~~TRINITY_DN5218_c0_g1_i1.p1  ORF type:complete len:124 (-),score=15.42 TRINITY_DN5218_c0_g1_i1:131-502(-)
MNWRKIRMLDVLSLSPISGANESSLVTEFSSILPNLLTLVDSIKSGKADNELAKDTNALNNSFAACLKTLDSLPGTEFTRQEQEDVYNTYQEKLRQKCETIAQFQRLGVFQLGMEKQSDQNEK